MVTVGEEESLAKASGKRQETSRNPSSAIRNPTKENNEPAVYGPQYAVV